MKMPFGKYKDRELIDVPKHYLHWLRRQQWVGAWLVKEINDVLDGTVAASNGLSFEETLKNWNDNSLAHHGDEPAKVDG
jgi:hypothetical protein